MSKARASAMRPLVIPVLFTTCVALLAGNSVVLLLNLQTLPSSESNVDHVRPGTHTELLATCPTYREIVESQMTAEEAA